MPDSADDTPGDVAAVVPTFRPPESVIGLLTGLQDMVDAVLVVDDASPTTFDSLFRQPTVPVIRHRRNLGIAHGLNAGLRFARDAGALWLLTVDQDSNLPTDHVRVLLRTASRAADSGLDVGAVAAGTVLAAGTPLSYPINEESGVATTTEVFQSGTLWNVVALAEIGGFDTSFGMDGVDAAACLALREHGYRIVVEPDASFTHGYGTSRPVRLLGRTVMSTHHSPERRSQMINSRMRLLPRELQADKKQAWRSLRRVSVNSLLAVTVEHDRREQFKATVRGLLGGPAR